MTQLFHITTERSRAYALQKIATLPLGDWVKFGKQKRSLPQNAQMAVWYIQLSMELPEDDQLGWKSYCKLHHGVPIMRLDDEFRECYDASIKLLTYEQKLIAMRHFPVTSLMNKEQLSKYAEAVQADFRARGIQLEFQGAAS